MRIVLQRVTHAEVMVGDETVAAIGPGLVALAGVAAGDAEAQAFALGRKAARLRIFEAGASGAEESLATTNGQMLVVSQFTLLADTRRGNRPAWSAAALAREAEPLVEAFTRGVAVEGVDVRRGRFGAHMRLSLTNDGPVTIVLES